jgi:hypothetical protein
MRDSAREKRILLWKSPRLGASAPGYSWIVATIG